jgi:hypothetical protein
MIDPCRSASAALFGLVTLAAIQDPLRDLPRRQRLRGRREHVHRGAVHRASLEPRVRLAALHGDAAEVVGWVQHLDDGFDVKHLASEALGLFLVLQYLAAQLGVQPFKGLHGGRWNGLGVGRLAGMVGSVAGGEVGRAGQLSCGVCAIIPLAMTKRGRFVLPAPARSFIV